MSEIIPYSEISSELDTYDSRLKGFVHNHKQGILRVTYEFCSDLWAAVQILGEAMDSITGEVLNSYNEWIYFSSFNKSQGVQLPYVRELDYEKFYGFLENMIGETIQEIPKDNGLIQDLIDKLLEKSKPYMSIYYDLTRFFEPEYELNRLSEASGRINEKRSRRLDELAEKQRQGLEITELEHESYLRMDKFTAVPQDIERFKELLKIIEGNQDDFLTKEPAMLEAPKPSARNSVSLTAGMLEVLVHGRFPEYMRYSKLGNKDGLKQKVDELRGLFEEYISVLEAYAENPSRETLLRAVNSKQGLSEELQFLRNLTDPQGRMLNSMKTIGDILIRLKEEQAADSANI